MGGGGGRGSEFAGGGGTEVGKEWRELGGGGRRIKCRGSLPLHFFPQGEGIK
jgi:hypothetical protein